MHLIDIDVFLEIVLLQGESASITSIISSEPMTPLHALWRVRLLIICMYAILLVSVAMTVERTLAVILVLIFQPFIVVFLLYGLSFVQALRKPLYSHTLMRYLYRLELTKYMFGTRTSGVVFTLLLLQTEKVAEVMNELLPTPHSRVWKK
ncbi:hypothetical protein EDC04DRAFT_2675436 [Pisolithus marmoratus]|nr:hypothetical protein EDC04DRAFT_2675436 [Pisolithus marmoratus]